ncbi:MAG: chemotaxis protein CheA, partial [Cytophagales bacterium]|nr:chemotaxis protein CheA [Cytophagales bacterium]
IKEIFLAESLEQVEELNKLFTELEKNHASKRAINAIFRITHTLKANAAGMGFDDIAGMAHVLEDIFSEIKNNRLVINTALFNDLFRANDTLAAMIGGVKAAGAPVKFRGIKTKLEVVLRNTRSDQAAAPTEKPIEASEPAKTITAAPETPAPLPDNELVPAAEVPPVHNPVAVEPETVKEIAHVALSVAETTDVALPAEEEAEETAPENEEEENKITLSDNIHIPIRKLDNLLNLVGELLIERDRMIAVSGEHGRTRNNEFARLQRITSELQYSVMDVRLVQVDVLFSKFHRIVRDVAALEGKQVDLVLEGTQNEIDRTILQIISDSLIHLVRNAISHGIETPEKRQQAGKPAAGTVRLSARSEKDAVFIDITDDGKGIDAAVIRRKAVEKGLIKAEAAAQLAEEDVIGLIFEPGFSSAETVTAVSGRGVGMDVVRRSLDSIGGLIEVRSTVGQGTTMSLRLPSSMAVKGALLFELGPAAFAMPLAHTRAVISVPRKQIHKLGNGLVATHLGKNIPVVFLNDLFGLGSLQESIGDGRMHQTFNQVGGEAKLNVIVVTFNNREIGFVVDKLLQQKEIVEKPIGPPLDNIKFISGATILGNGSVCLVLDAPAIIHFLFRNTKMAK